MILPPEKLLGAHKDERVPQIMLFSSGEMSQFAWTLRRAGGAGVKLVPDPEADTIKATALAAAPT